MGAMKVPAAVMYAYKIAKYTYDTFYSVNDYVLCTGPNQKLSL